MPSPPCPQHGGSWHPRQLLAQTLVSALASSTSKGKAFVLVAERGPAIRDLEPPFAAMPADPADGLGAPEDATNLPLGDGSDWVQKDLQELRDRA